MEPSTDRLRRTLRSLGSSRLAPRPAPVQKPDVDWARLCELSGGDVVARADQDGFLALRHTFALDHQHGRLPLSRALSAQPDTLCLLSRDPRLAGMDPSAAAFFDTETTGLGTATGTLVFLVGVGRFVDGGFEVVQYFLPGPASEAAFLSAIREGFGQDPFLVSYNGKCFDAPLLQARYTMQRQRLALTHWPHLDLLHPARSLYRPRVPDCRLGTIERFVLGVVRSQADVPSALIPSIYFDYLRTGAVDQLGRVFYHNLVDILSLAGLSASEAAALEGRPECTHPCDHLGAAKLLESTGRLEEAEAAYRRALVVATGRTRIEPMQRLGSCSSARAGTRPPPRFGGHWLRPGRTRKRWPRWSWPSTWSIESKTTMPPRRW